MPNQFYPALGAAGRMIEFRDAALGRNGMGTHDANGIAGTKERRPRCAVYARAP